MRRLTLAGHYGQSVDLDLCRHCDLVWFDETETARLSGNGLLALIGDMAEAHTLPHELLRDGAVCPRCAGRLKVVHNQTRWGRSLQLQCLRRHGAYQSFAQFLEEKGLLRPMSRVDRAKLLQERGRIECVNCGADVAVADERCSFCRSVPSLLDIARLARALDPEDAIDKQAVHARVARQSAMQCAACGAALPPEGSMRCAQCGATLAIPSLAEAYASVEALAPALRSHAERPAPRIVKRRLDALDADLPRRREWVATMERESSGSDAPSGGGDFEWTSLLRSGTNPVRGVLIGLVVWFAWWKLRR
ncbi:MAG: hypothetical protein ABI641_09260 [Caldimonas sp.]